MRHWGGGERANWGTKTKHNGRSKAATASLTLSRPPRNTPSGLKVRFLKVWEKSSYQTVKWVRYLTRAGDEGVPGSYETRITDAS